MRERRLTWVKPRQARPQESRSAENAFYCIDAHGASSTISSPESMLDLATWILRAKIQMRAEVREHSQVMFGNADPKCKTMASTWWEVQFALQILDLQRRLASKWSVCGIQVGGVVLE